ncbi:MAG: TIM barrel protein [Desulfurococcus sp.]|nr:TIM barrel protein [Desulfurococcus sp.]
MPKYWFGPAGKPLGLKSKSILDAPGYIRQLGLNAMEYEAVRGVDISVDKARRLGLEASRFNVKLSLHAPYYINLAGRSSIVEKSIRHLTSSLDAASAMGAYIVVFHPGYYTYAPSKRAALEKVIASLEGVVEYRDKRNYTGIYLGPETAGRISQIGDLSEIVEISRRFSGVRPVVDFAHLYARYMGRFVRSKSDVVGIVEVIERELGSEYLKPLHTHFSKIEYGRGGERMHHALSEEAYGPGFTYVCEALCETGVDAVFISESPLLEQDAVVMRDTCLNTCGENCIAE